MHYTWTGIGIDSTFFFYQFLRLRVGAVTVPTELGWFAILSWVPATIVDEAPNVWGTAASEDEPPNVWGTAAFEDELPNVCGAAASADELPNVLGDEESFVEEDGDFQEVEAPEEDDDFEEGDFVFDVLPTVTTESVASEASTPFEP